MSFLFCEFALHVEQTAPHVDVPEFLRQGHVREPIAPAPWRALRYPEEVTLRGVGTGLHPQDRRAAG